MTKFQRRLSWFLSIAVVIATVMLLSPKIKAASNDFTDYWSIKGRGTLINTSILYLDSALNFVFAPAGTAVWMVDTSGNVTTSANFIVSEDDIQWGSSTTAISTATTAGTGQGELFTAYLTGSHDALEGSLLIATTPVSGQGFSVVVSTYLDQTNWVGVSAAATSVSNVIQLYTSGVVLVRTTQTVVPGDVLVSTVGAAGYMAADASPTSGAAVAVALSNGTPTGGLTKARLR